MTPPNLAHAALALALLSGCENDVSLRLLQRPPEPEVCIDGDPCSGLEYALHFKGAYDRVEIPSSAALDVPRDFTLEAWVLVKSYVAGHGVFNRWARGLTDLQLTFGAPELLPQLELMSTEPVPSHVLASWGFVRADYWVTVSAPSRPSVDDWHHLAASYGGGSFRLYVDGALQASMLATEPVANAASTIYLGATARSEQLFDPAQGSPYWPPIDGFISDVRLSSVNRYAADFTPDLRLSADAETLALWHLDEAQGTAIADSGPHSAAGTIVGAQWALAPRR